MHDLSPPPARAATASPALQRSRGAASVALSTPGGRLRLSRLAQSGSAKAFLPRCHGVAPEIVFLNTSGGLTGGDRLSYDLDLGADSAAVGTTQTAERAYAACSGTARIDVRLRAGPGATLHWLPQETILFDRSALHRRTRVDLGAGARVVMLESVVLGRVAMGERVTSVDMTDWREVRVAGRPVLVDPLRLDTTALAHGEDPAVLDGAVALATLAVVGRDAEAALVPLRDALQDVPDSVRAAVSAWAGKTVVRALARDAFDLRRAMARCVAAATGAPLPRVWAA